MVVHGNFTRESGYRCAQKLLRRRSRPTAIFAANDPMALGVFDAALEAGLNVPRDLSVVGFDDTPMATHVNPPLTTVARPYREMGARAIELLVEAIDQVDAYEPRQVDLATRLIVRQSTRNL
jgi:DNA-binding LacI/PurR family transcriptional regulator